ncbi:hypothetical protein Ciccas_007289 [Cichlidogyrus casuarinus]|uniref:Nucleolar complex protein 2 homolog n=1 Tax=Cichlidogyrus casuarinus TaxID=1844966 RepID=A0ABD2Q3M6_9PLAT
MEFDETEPRSKKAKLDSDDDDDDEEDSESSDEVEETMDLDMREKLAKIVNNPFLRQTGEDATEDDFKHLDEALEQAFGKQQDEEEEGTNSAMRKMANQARELRQLKMKLLDFFGAIIKTWKHASLVLFCLRSVFEVAQQSQQTELKMANNKKKQSSLKLAAKYEDMVACSALRSLVQCSLQKAHLLTLPKKADQDTELVEMTKHLLDQLSKQSKAPLFYYLIAFFLKESFPRTLYK